MNDQHLFAQQFLNLKIGPYQLYAIPTGLFGLDGGAMFGTVPKTLWNKTNPSDDLNRISMEARALLLVSPTHKILIDTGNGDHFTEKYGEKLGPKFSEIYGLKSSDINLNSSLLKLNFTTDDITHVILTHLHFDHAGGATTWRDQKIQATFKNARYYVQKENLEVAQNPNVRERASYLPQNFEPLLKENKLEVLSSSKSDELPHIEFFISHGHTKGHQAVIIEDNEHRLIYCGDVIPTSSHLRSAWVMGYDLEPLKIIEEKKSLLKLSENKKTFYFFEHDPYCDLALIEKDREEFKLKEKYWLKNI